MDYEADDDESIVVRTRYGIAVYTNERGDTVIRQDGGWEEDAIVVVQRQDIQVLILALQMQSE